jgi:hypothetical protein
MRLGRPELLYEWGSDRRRSAWAVPHALQNWEQNLEKAVDNSVICAKIICDIATRYEKEAAQDTMSEEGTVRAFGGIRCGPLSCGLRDQDGSSRYRATKMLSLQRSRVVPRESAPVREVALFYFVYF